MRYALVAGRVAVGLFLSWLLWIPVVLLAYEVTLLLRGIWGLLI